MKNFFKLFMRIHVYIYRLTGGRIGGRSSGTRGFGLLLLNSTGRKTGKAHTNPLGYFINDDSYVIIASYTAFGAYPAWYYNLTDNPNTTIQVMKQVIKVKASVADSVERQRLWEKLMEIAPGYGDYQKRTERLIPIVVLLPTN
ncbi:MAG: nitroreductase family deazaflavin-dependent oxidoreductase [Chloroflexi bacterium]|nr:nitroreductase family deazaflavin-dependent oxidoreductase [Chloroflexota bacterium]